jgi:hypothetical protein
MPFLHVLERLSRGRAGAPSSAHFAFFSRGLRLLILKDLLVPQPALAAVRRESRTTAAGSSLPDLICFSIPGNS